MSLRTRLMLLVLLATLLPALWVGWRFVRDSDEEIASAERALSAAVDNLAADLDHRVQGTAQLHYGLARSGLLDGSDREACSTYLSEVREAYPQYTGIVTALPDGRLFCDSLRSGRQVDLRDRPYFQRVIDGAGLTLEPVFGRITGNAVLQVVYPARTPEGSLRFMLIASLNLKKFAQEARWQASGAAPQLAIVDRHGVLMAWASEGTAPVAAGTSLAATPLFAFAQARPEGGVGELPGADGRSAMVWAVTGHAAARQAGLHLMLGLPKAELVASARTRLRQDLGFGLGAAALLFIGVWLFAEWSIREPVGRIVNMVRTLGSGDLGARIARPYPRGELGSLMAALNSTAASLERQRKAIDELSDQLRQAQKLEAIGTLAGGIAHDFNNVLGAILGNLSIAADEAANGQPTQQSLEQIRRAALRARDLVQRIQAFGRRDAPKLASQPLQPIVEEVLALVQVASPAGVTLRAELQPLSGRVLADATQLHQVLMNLCTNAWQSLEGRAGTVSVGLEELVFEADARRPVGLGAGRHAHLWVRDTGCGIEEVARARVFEPFFTTRGSHGGTGLGLSMVHGIVKAHHGAVELESTQGQGSCFHVYLPLLDAGAAPDASTAPSPLDGPRGGGEHIVYVDDDEVMRLMVERLLTRAGYRVSTHASAQAALAVIGATPGGCDLVVTDFNMPELSGLEVSRQLATLRPGLPVLIISGYIADDLAVQARSHGVRGLVRKENVLEELVPAIARALGPAI